MLNSNNFLIHLQVFDDSSDSKDYSGTAALITYTYGTSPSGPRMVKMTHDCLIENIKRMIFNDNIKLGISHAFFLIMRLEQN
jgi:hypothetical protein